MSVERSDKDKDADENVDADQVRTGRPVGSEQSIDLCIQREERDIDFRVSGLPHAVVKQAENFCVRELVKKIESHPHREALQADLQQSNANNPFSDDSKAMIREMGNVELFDLCETIPKVQCSECLLYWNQGIVYCTCGHLLKNESSRHLHQWRLDVLSIPNCVIKKVRPHGARHGKTEAQKEHFMVHHARKRCIKKKFRGIHDRFQRDLRYRDAQLKSWSDWGEVHRDGRVGTERFHLSPINWGVWEKKEKLVYLSEHIWQKCTDEIPIRLPRSINKDAPSSPWVWRRATCTDSFLPVSEMAFVVFIQYIMVAVEWPLVELINSSTSIPLSSWNEGHQRTGRLDEDASLLSCSEWHFDKIF